MSITSKLPFDVLSQIFNHCEPEYFVVYDVSSWSSTDVCGLDKASLVCRSWKNPAQRILFRRVCLLEPMECNSFLYAIRGSDYLRKSVRIVHFGPSERTREKNFQDVNAPDTIFSIIKLLGPTLYHLTIPTTYHLDEFHAVNVDRLKSLDSCFSSYRPLDLQLPSSLASFSSSLNLTSSRRYEALNNLSIRIIGPNRLTTLGVTTSRATTDLFGLISSVSGFNQVEGAKALSTTFDTLKRFNYRADTDPEVLPSRLVLEAILPKFQSLEVLSVLSHSISSKLLHNLPGNMKFLEVKYHFPTLSIEDLTHPLQDPSFKSSLETIVIVMDDDQIEEYDYDVNIELPSTRIIDLEFSEVETGTYYLFQLYDQKERNIDVNVLGTNTVETSEG